MNTTNYPELDGQIKKILVKLMSGGQLDTSKLPPNVMIDAPSIDLQEATQSIRELMTREIIKELNKAHRAGGTTEVDNVTDEYIDERVEQLSAGIKNKEGSDARNKS